MKKSILVIVTISALCIGSFVGCGKADQNSESSAQPATSNVTEEAVSAVAENPVAETIDYSPYDELIAEATEILSNGRDADAVASERMSSVFVMQGDYETLGYLRQDLDGDGVEELIFGGNSDLEEFNGIIYDIYTIDNGELVHVLDGWERNRFYLCTNGCIANEASGGAFLSAYQYYTYADAKISIKETVEYNEWQDQDNPWFYTTIEVSGLEEDDIDNLEPISEEKAFEIMDSYEYIELEYTPFVEKTVTTEEVESEINEDELVYYSGQLRGEKDDFHDSNEIGNVVSVEKDGNTLHMYASLCKSEGFEDVWYEEKREYIDYADYDLELADTVAYYGVGGEGPREEYTEEEFYDICDSYNGLTLILKVENGVVTEAYVAS